MNLNRANGYCKNSMFGWCSYKFKEQFLRGALTLPRSTPAAPEPNGYENVLWCVTMWVNSEKSMFWCLGLGCLCLLRYLPTYNSIVTSILGIVDYFQRLEMRKRRGRDGLRDGILQVFAAIIIINKLRQGQFRLQILNPARRTDQPTSVLCLIKIKIGIPLIWK